MTTKSGLEALLNQRQLWRAGDPHGHTTGEQLSTGLSSLDALLPQAGWPRNALVELLCSEEGIGQIQLLIPALRTLSQHQHQWIAWINPPHIPYAPALSDAGVALNRLLIIRTKEREQGLWAAEQCIQSRACSAVLTWPGKGIPAKAVRRIQVACKSHRVWGVLFRSANEHVLPSPAPFRMLLSSESHTITDDGVIHRHLGIEVFKRANGWAHPKITVPFDLGQPLEGIDQLIHTDSMPAAQSATISDDEQTFENRVSGRPMEIRTYRQDNPPKQITPIGHQPERVSYRSTAETLRPTTAEQPLKTPSPADPRPALTPALSQEIH